MKKKIGCTLKAAQLSSNAIFMFHTYVDGEWLGLVFCWCVESVAGWSEIISFGVSLDGIPRWVVCRNAVTDGNAVSGGLVRLEDFSVLLASFPQHKSSRWSSSMRNSREYEEYYCIGVAHPLRAWSSTILKVLSEVERVRWIQKWSGRHFHHSRTFPNNVKNLLTHRTRQGISSGHSACVELLSELLYTYTKRCALQIVGYVGLVSFITTAYVLFHFNKPCSIELILTKFEYSVSLS